MEWSRAMYHALVCENGDWVSFGLHVPSNQWTHVFQSLQNTYGHQNVTYVFWRPEDQLVNGDTVRLRMERDVQLADCAQSEWDRGNLHDMCDENGRFNISGAIVKLRKTKQHYALSH
jgi:hypothetical protein